MSYDLVADKGKQQQSEAVLQGTSCIVKQSQKGHTSVRARAPKLLLFNSNEY